jgi:hypothetical protein
MNSLARIHPCRSSFRQYSQYSIGELEVPLYVVSALDTRAPIKLLDLTKYYKNTHLQKPAFDIVERVLKRYERWVQEREWRFDKLSDHLACTWKGPRPKVLAPAPPGTKAKHMDSAQMAKLEHLYNPEPEEFDIGLVFGLNAEETFDLCHGFPQSTVKEQRTVNHLFVVKDLPLSRTNQA